MNVTNPIIAHGLGGNQNGMIVGNIFSLGPLKGEIIVYPPSGGIPSTIPVHRKDKYRVVEIILYWEDKKISKKFTVKESTIKVTIKIKKIINTIKNKLKFIINNINIRNKK